MKKQKIANKKKELKNKEKTKTVKKGKMAEKNSSTIHTFTRVGTISIDGNRWGVHPCMLQSRTA